MQRIRTLWSSGSERCRCVALDASLLMMAIALWFGMVPLVSFHLVFVILTIAAFVLDLRRFISRLFIGSAVAAAGIAMAASRGHLDPQEMLEVPLLALVASLVALVARSRSNTEAALRQAHAELRNFMGRYEMLVTSVPAVVYTAEMGVDGAWDFVSPQVRDLLGVESVDLMSGRASWFDLIREEDRERVLAEEVHAFETNSQLASEYRIVLPDGNERWVRDEAVVLSTQGVDRPRFHGVITDITSHKDIQRDLAARVRQEAAIAELGRAAIAACGVDGLLDRAVELIAETLEVEYCKVLELLPNDDGLLLRAGRGWNEGVVGSFVVSTGLESQAGYTLIADEPVVVDDLATETRFSGPPLLHEHGVVSGLSTIIRDNGRHFGVLGAHTSSARHFSATDAEFLAAMANIIATAIRLERAEAQIAFQQRRFEAAFEAAVSAIALVRPNGAFISVNPAMADLLGYSDTELLEGHDFKSITHPDDVDACVRAAHQVVTGARDQVQLLKRYIRKDGDVVWTELSLAPVKGDDGQVQYLVAQSFDVTARVSAEQARERFFNTSVDLLCIAGFDGYFKEINPAWEATLGYSKDELMSVPYLDLVHPDDRAATSSAAASLAEGKAVLEFSNRYIHKDGSVRWLEWRSIPLPDEQRVFAIARDMTAHRELELQLRQSQKMEAVGRLAGGVAHDFNNLLGVVLNYCDFVEEEIAAGGDAVEDLHEIRAAAERGTRLVAQLLAFSRKDVLQARPVDLNEVVSGFAKLLQRTLGEDIALSITPAPDLPPIESDPGHIDQIVMNLAVNARDAMPTGGSLWLETSKVTLEELRETSAGTIPPGNYVCLSVSDTGSGIARADLEHIFEPFFTTKAVGEGTGLGLATTYANVVEAGGYVGVYSEVGHGTTFRLYWPALEQGPVPLQHEEQELDHLDQRLRVLVIEDDEAIRKITARILTSAHHEVTTVSNVEQAREAFGASAFDLVISDVIMPGGSGPEMVGDLRKQGHSFEVIYMSGYTNNVLSRHVSVEDATFLQKPFQASELLRALDEVLA